MTLQKESRAGANGAASLQQNKPVNLSVSEEKSKIITPQTPMLAIALELTKQGLPVFPCSASKVPTCPSGFKAASSNPDEVRRLWAQYPGILAGVPTGTISGIAALDIDPRHGGNQWLAEYAPKLPKTRTNRTRSGGVHFIFQHPSGLRNSTSRIAPGVDVRAEGGCVIWWPAAGLPILDDTPPAPWPEWLLTMALPPPLPPPQHNPVPSVDYGNVGNAYAHAALRRAAANVAAAAEGTRNSTLNRESWALMRFVATGLLDPQAVADTLTTAAFSAGLSRGETIATLTSVLRARGIA
ncbi:MAG: bifunctional DNA primase/polymerase [Alphaproteobacteria bacterium]